MAMMALPQNAPEALRHLTDLLDEIWYQAGDRSVDVRVQEFIFNTEMFTLCMLLNKLTPSAILSRKSRLKSRMLSTPCYLRYTLSCVCQSSVKQGVMTFSLFKMSGRYLVIFKCEMYIVCGIRLKIHISTLTFCSYLKHGLCFLLLLQFKNHYKMLGNISLMNW